MMFGNYLLSDLKVKTINIYNDKPAAGYCTKCGDGLYEQCKDHLVLDVRELTTELEESIDYVPVLSIQLPQGWEYDVLAIVTGQSVSGTGVIAEFTSSFSDLFGTQSSTLSGKLRGGEKYCFNQVRKRALDLGGNAVIGTDIDYSEVGSIRGMLLVCMAGTAVRLKNVNILGEDRKDKLKRAVEVNKKLEDLIELLPKV